MKQKLAYLALLAAVVSSSVFALMRVEVGSMIPSTSKLQSNHELGYASDEVSDKVDQLQQDYPHLKHPCLYATAMVLDDQAHKIPTLLETESKCVHNLVIHEGQKAHSNK